MKVLFRRFLIITLLAPSMVFGRQNSSPQPQTLKTVTIDAGHGGHDPGCVYGSNYEKDINLNVALLLGGMIEEAYPEITVVYTRKDDTFVELVERGNIANRANSDLFISIHTDAVKDNPQANGNSTYIMGNDKATANLEVAKRENAVITLESDYQTKYEGYDPSSAESFIIFSLMQYAHSEQSMVFAEMVQRQYAAQTSITDRGARQAPYLVLWRTAMPSVLTELGFISNAKDRAYLTSKEGQQRSAKALFDAFALYKTKCDNKAGEAFAASLPKSADKTAAKPAAKQSVEPTVKSDAPQKPAAQTATAQKADATTPKADAATAQKSDTAAKSAEPKFYVQLCMLSAESNPADKKFKSYSGRIVQIATPTGRWRCLVAADDYASAVELRREAEREFSGAFVAAFLDGEHIPLDKALKMTKSKK